MVLYLLLVPLSILFYLYWFQGNNNKGGQGDRSLVSTTVLKTGVHCPICAKKIKTVLKKVKGVMEVSADQQEELVTVKGTMDDRELIKKLKKELNKHAEIVKKKLRG